VNFLGRPEAEGKYHTCQFSPVAAQGQNSSQIGVKKMHLSSKGCAFPAVALARLVAATRLDLDAEVKKKHLGVKKTHLGVKKTHLAVEDEATEKRDARFMGQG
jgi:hypothetical protein